MLMHLRVNVFDVDRSETHIRVFVRRKMLVLGISAF